MVEVIAGLNAVSNAANQHVSNESSSSAPLPLIKALTLPESTLSSLSADAPSFDDSVEYPVVGRDDIMRARGGVTDDRSQNAGPGKGSVGHRKRAVIPCFCPDPLATSSFDGYGS